MPIVSPRGIQLSSQPDFLKLDSFTTVDGGKTSSLALPKQWNYLTLWIRLLTGASVALTDAEIATALTEVRLLVNGTPQYRLSATQIQMLNAFYQAASDGAVSANQGYLPIYLARPWMMDIEGQDEPAWGASGLNSLTLEFDQAGAGVADFATLYAEVAPAAPLGRYISVLPFQLNAMGSGESPVFNVLPQDATQSLYAVHFLPTANSLTSITVKPDGRTPLLDHIPLAVWNQTLRRYGMNPAGTYHNVPFVRRRRHADALPLGDPNFAIVPEWSGAPGATVMLAEIAQNG